MQSHLFVSSQDGALYDTRVQNWSRLPPLRAVFNRHARQIQNAADFKATLRAGATTDMGGYPLYFIMADGAALSFNSARDNLRQILSAFVTPDRQWRPVAVEINYEDGDLYCAHSNERIPSAYADE